MSSSWRPYVWIQVLEMAPGPGVWSPFLVGFFGVFVFLSFCDTDQNWPLVSDGNNDGKVKGKCHFKNQSGPSIFILHISIILVCIIPQYQHHHKNQTTTSWTNDTLTQTLGPGCERIILSPPENTWRNGRFEKCHL